MNDRSLHVVLVVAVGTVVWLVSRGGLETQPSAPIPGAGAKSDDAATPRLQAVGPDYDAERQRIAPRSDPKNERESSDAQLVQVDPARSIVGRVVFPEGTPSDERCVVVLESLPVRKKGDLLGSARHWFGHWIEVGRVEAQPDGRFGLRLPRVADAVRVNLDARYVYLAQPLKVENLKQPNPLQLEPKLGAHVTFVLTPPPRTFRDPEVLAGRRLTLSHFPRSGLFISGRAPEIEFEVKPDLTFEGRGLAVDRRYQIDPSFRESNADSGLVPFVVEADWDPILTAGKHLRVEIPLLEGLQLAGRVGDTAGKPIGGAQVIAKCRFGRGGVSNYYAESDEEGRFTLRGVYPTLERLGAASQGWLAAWLEGASLGEGLDREGFELVLTQGLSIAGSLRVPDGRPVTGARVEVRPMPGDPYAWCFYATTDADGNFTVNGLEEGKYAVSARVRIDLQQTGEAVQPAARTSEAPLLTVEHLGAAAGESRLALVLKGKPLLRGRVVDDRGLPVSHFSLVAANANQGGRRHFRGPDPDPTFFRDFQRGFESEDGTFEWDELPAGTWFVAARGGASGESSAVRVEIPGEGSTIEFVLSRGAAVSGVVVDELGTPVPRAQVSSVRVTPGMRISGPGARSDIEGRFRIEGLAAGHHELWATAKELLTASPTEMELPAGAEVADTAIRLVRGGYLLCEVKRPDGSPAVGATVRPETRGFDSASRQGETDGDGRAELGPFPPVEVTLVAYITDAAAGHSTSASAVARVLPGETVRVVIEGAASSPVTARGFVRLGGKPVPACEVIATVQGGGQVSTVTDASGAFELGLLAGGCVEFRLIPEGARNPVPFSENVPLEGRHTVNFELSTAGIRGRLILFRSETAEKFEVVARLRPTNGAVRWHPTPRPTARPEQDGAFSLPYLKPGTYDLFAGLHRVLAAHPEGEAAVALLRGIEVQAGVVVEDVELLLAGTGTVQGRVLDTGGAPVAGALVIARLADGSVLPTWPVYSAHDGLFAATGLPAGTLLLEACTPDGVTRVPAEAHVRTDTPVNVDLQIAAGTVLTCRLAAGLDVEGLLLRLVDSQEVDRAQDLRPRGPRHALDARARAFGPLPPGSYQIELLLSDETVCSATLELRGEPEREITLGAGVELSTSRVGD